MADLDYPVLLAPQDSAPIYPNDPIVVAGRRMSAATALTRYSAEQLQGFGFELPGVEDIRAIAKVHVQTVAEEILKRAAGGYAWPEAAAWVALEEQSRNYLADPSLGAGPDLAADVGDTSDLALVAERAAVVVAKADVFRTLSGSIKRGRREGIEAVEGAESADDVKAAAAAHVALIEAIA
jgi:hypothetical protein